jgi:hypothetical protein
VRAEGRGARGEGPGPRAQGGGPKPRAQGQGLRAQGPGLRAQGPGLRAQGPGARTERADRGERAERAESAKSAEGRGGRRICMEERGGASLREGEGRRVIARGRCEARRGERQGEGRCEARFDFVVIIVILMVCCDFQALMSFGVGVYGARGGGAASAGVDCATPAAAKPSRP